MLSEVSRRSSSIDYFHEAEHGLQDLLVPCHEQREGNFFGEPRVGQGVHPANLSSSKGSCGERFPPTGLPFPFANTRYQIGRAHEAAFCVSRADVHAEMSHGLRSSYVYGLQPNGVGYVNPEMAGELPEQIAFPGEEMEYPVRRERADIGACNREYNIQPQVMKAIEAMKALNVCGYSAADIRKLAKINNLSNQEDLVQDLRATASSIAQISSLFESDPSERTNGALNDFSEWLYQQRWPASVAELNRMRSYGLNAESIQSCPAIGLVQSRRTSGPGLLSGGSTIVSNNSGRPTPVISSGMSTAVDVRAAVSGPPSRGRRQETSFKRGRNTPERKPDGYLGNSNSPQKLKTSTYSEVGAMQTFLGADDNIEVNSVAVTGFHQKTPTRACPGTCDQNGSGMLDSLSSVKNEGQSYSTQLPGQKGFKYHVAFAGQDDGSSGDSSALLQTNPKKALIAQGGKSISILLKPDNSASRKRSCYPAAPCLSGGSPPESTGLPRSLSPIHRRGLSKSDPTVSQAAVQMPVQRPLVEFDVWTQGQFKTELCNNWQTKKFCSYGITCRFAHGAEELRFVLRHPRYKTIPCRMIMHGKACMYGDRCHFRHSLTEKEKELSFISVIDVHEVSVHEHIM